MRLDLHLVRDGAGQELAAEGFRGGTGIEHAPAGTQLIEA
jgi:hypothetical protein